MADTGLVAFYGSDRPNLGGSVFAAGDRILLAEQANPETNGVYVVAVHPKTGEQYLARERMAKKRVWISSSGTIPIAKMGTDHLLNAIRMLEQRAFDKRGVGAVPTGEAYGWLIEELEHRGMTKQKLPIDLRGADVDELHAMAIKEIEETMKVLG